MSKGIDALRLHRNAANNAADVPDRILDIGVKAYRECVDEGIAPPFDGAQAREMVRRVYRAMRFAVLW